MTIGNSLNQFFELCDLVRPWRPEPELDLKWMKEGRAPWIELVNQPRQQERIVAIKAQLEGLAEMQEFLDWHWDSRRRYGYQQWEPTGTQTPFECRSDVHQPGKTRSETGLAV